MSEIVATYVTGTGLQEVLTGDQLISSSCHHTKVYSTERTCNMTLGRGVQKGQLKKITFIHKGLDGAVVNINCTNMKHGNTRIVMSKKGDQIELVWLGGVWAVLSTLNYENMTSNTPVVL